MQKPGHRLLIVASILLGGCVTQPKVMEPVITRPVIVVDRADTELVAAIDMLRTGKYPQAEVHLEEIIKARPDIPEAYFNLGWARQQLNRHEAAIGSYQTGLKLRPDNAPALNQLGFSQRETGRFADAEASYLKAIATDPGFDKPQLNLGILYELYLKQRALAVKYYQQYRALQTTPDPKVDGWIAFLEKQEAKP